MDSERKLLESYKTAKRIYEDAKRIFEMAEKDVKIKEKIIVGMLLEKNATQTTKFEGFGFASLTKLQVKAASVPKVNEPDFFNFVRKQGEADIIKEGIHPTTLRSFIKTCLEQEVELPKYIFYETGQGIRFYDRSK